MRSKLFNLCSALSLSLFATMLIACCLNARNDWVYFATYWRWPVVVNGYLEFGILGPERPFTPPAGKDWWIWNHPQGYGDTSKPPDVEFENARRLHWALPGKIEGISGIIIPPWGWTAGNKVPTVEIPYKEYSIPAFYLLVLFGLAPGVWLARWYRRRRRSSSTGFPVVPKQPTTL